MSRIFFSLTTLIAICLFYLAGCASMQGSQYSAQDRLSYPKASADAEQVLTLISNKDNTRFAIDGTPIGSPIGAGGELKVLVNKQSHDIVAQAAGYQAKPQHIQPPYDERSPVSFSFIYKDKLGNESAPAVAAVTETTAANLIIKEVPAQPVPPSKPIAAPAQVSPVPVKPTNFSSMSMDKSSSERRVALVIGNSAYQHTAPLANPTNDAQDVAQTLQKFNFQVILKTNADLETMADAVFQFGEKLKGGGVGLFYYSGHGLQVKGENYLLPVDANLMREDDVKRKAISANDIVDKMGEGKSHLNLVFLDACRNNPFPSGTRAVSRGLGGMSAPNGTLLIFSTNPDNVALDGDGRNGTYTKHLLQQISEPGVEVGMLLRKVRTAVKDETAGQQVPWENGSIEGEFYFSGK